MERAISFTNYLARCNFQICAYNNHVDNLHIQPGLNNLVIGPSTWMFELAALETSGTKRLKSICNISLVTAQMYTSLQRKLAEEFKQNYPKVALNLIENKPFQELLASNPSSVFDCVIFTGAHPTTIEPQDVRLILNNLEQGGLFNSTINCTALSTNYPQAHRILIDIPTNPTYPYPPGYIGVVWKK